MDNVKVTCNGKPVILKDTDYVTAGGQGKIYRKDGLIYKVYTCPIDSSLEKKLKILSCLKKDNIVAPKDVLYSGSGDPVGYTMNFVDNVSSLALFLTKSFQQRNCITGKHLEGIFLNMSETIKYIHDKKIITVDGNELNYLVSNGDWATTYFLDVDSYSFEGFPPQVIMPTIKDYRRDDYTVETDWYSFAVLMFQMYTGIHPYLGTHPTYNFFVDKDGNRQKKENILDRRKNLVSVYDKDVKYPAFVKLDQVPSNLDDWFRDIFDNGAYPPPPNLVAKQPRAQTVVAYSVGLTEAVKAAFGSRVVGVRVVNGELLVSTEEGHTLGQRQPIKRAFYRELPLVCLMGGQPTACSVTKDPDCLVLRINGVDHRLNVPGIGMISVIGNRLFGIVENQLVEFALGKYTGELAAERSWTVLQNATRFFPGLAYCDVFGSVKLYLPEEVNGAPAMHVVDLPELNGRQVIDAFYENGTVIAVSKFNGKYERTLAKFDKHFLKATVLQEECRLHEINAVTLSNGMCVSYDGETIEMSGMGVTSRRLVPVDTDVALAHVGNKVMGFRGDTLYDLTLK